MINDAIPSNTLAPDIAAIIATILSTPSNASCFIELAPSINGAKFVMNVDNLVPMFGSWSAIPEASAPMNAPSTSPSPPASNFNRPRPLSINQVNPGNNDKAPSPETKATIAATANPPATAPITANGPKITHVAAIPNMAVINPTPVRASINTLESTLLNPSAIPTSNATNISTPALTSSGILSASFCIMVSIIVTIFSHIGPIFSTNKSSISNINLNNVTAIVGIASAKDLTAVITIVVIDLQISGAIVAAVLNIDANPCIIAFAISGNNLTIPSIIRPIPPTITPIDAVIAAAKANNPIAIPFIPTAIRGIAIPKAAMVTPNTATANVNAPITGMRGAKAHIATTNIPMAPPIAINDLIIEPRDIEPKAFIGIISMFIAAAAVIKASVPVKLALIAFNPTANASIAPLIAINPFIITDKGKSPMAVIGIINIFIAAAAKTIAAAPGNDFSNSFMVTAISPSAMAITDIP